MISVALDCWKMRKLKFGGGGASTTREREGRDIMINPLSDKKARQLLRFCHFARLACVVNGDPYVIPINYKFENEFI